MDSYVALEAPAWLWTLACVALLGAGVAFGALAAYALRIRFALDRIDDYEEAAAPRADVERELAVVHARLARLEQPQANDEAPDTIEDSKPRTCVLPELWPRDDEITTTQKSVAFLPS